MFRLLAVRLLREAEQAREKRTASKLTHFLGYYERISYSQIMQVFHDIKQQYTSVQVLALYRVVSASFVLRPGFFFHFPVSQVASKFRDTSARCKIKPPQTGKIPLSSDP